MKKQLLTLCGIAIIAGVPSAQELKEGYVTFPDGQKLTQYVNAWNGGQGYFNQAGNSTTEANAWEDEEFFTSRIKPRTRVTATSMNIRDLGEYAGRRMMYWVPLGNSDTQGLPNGKFDSEAFSTWSYLDIYGSFTSPLGWVAGAWADAAHKNGVAVNGVASVPNASLSSTTWSTPLTTLGSTFKSNADALGKFLLYHGTDGLAYNSEFSSNSSVVTNLTSMHKLLMKYMATDNRNPVFENIWYDGTNDNGGISFDSFLSGKTGIYSASSIFSNYNWVNPGSMSSASSTANNVNDYNGNKRGPWWNYAGCNYEGGQPGGSNYSTLGGQKWSVGYWGAHSVNMIWANRNGGGSTVEGQQLYYHHQHEMFFGNGKRNPAIDQPYKNVSSHRPSADFHGASKYINERSALTHVIANEPFYTFFNLGNGRYFNWRGVRMNNNEWYSLGFQDYLPTWRWWFAPTWMQKSVTDSDVDGQLTADFTFDDAYMGGSCLKIEGSTAKEYLHLFKAQMKVDGSQRLRVRYKLLNGEGDVRLVLASANGATTEAKNSSMKEFYLFKKAECESIQDQSYKDGEEGWVTKEWKFEKLAVNNTNLKGGLGAIGLEFVDANGMELLLGELSILPASNTATPAAPKVKKSKVLANTYKGVDGKIFWTMDNDAARKAGTPKYNSDVNTSFFKVWSREEGGSEEFVGVTTSWAAIAFQAANTNDSKKIQFGVSAVSADTQTESAISWGDYLSKGSYNGIDDIQIDKQTIKRNEGFEISYVDPKHSNSNWKLYSSTGSLVASVNNATVFSVPDGLAEMGGYNLVIDEGTAKERTFGYYVQVSREEVGAMPEVLDILVDGKSVKDNSANITIGFNDHPILSYLGRFANGSASRANNLNGHTIGAEVADLGLAATPKQSFSIAGWYKFKAIPENTWAFINAADKIHASWPINEWGWCWNTVDSDGQVELVFRGNTDSGSPGELHYTFPGLKLQANAWTHIALIHEYSGNNFRVQLYVNGIKQNGYFFQYATGNNTGSARSVNGKTYGWTCTVCGKSNCTNGDHKNAYGWRGTTSSDDYCESQTYALTTGAQIYFGGPKYQGGTVDGTVDDFQVWDKAMTAAEVKQSMDGFTDGNYPSGLLAIWDFETEPNSDNKMISKGRKQVALANYDINGGESGRKQSFFVPAFESGCPFLQGTAYPIITKATWTDKADRRTIFAPYDPSSRASYTESEQGHVKVTFRHDGDHNISISLGNDYGSDEMDFPIYTIDPTITAIDGIVADGDLKTYTIDRIFFLEFGKDGNYSIDMYNTAGMLVASERKAATAGSNAQIEVGTPGVYLVKVSEGANVVRTIKILVK